MEKKHTYKKYTEETLKLALEDVKNNKISVRAASKKYNVPFSSLLLKYKTNTDVIKRSGPMTILSSEEENSLIKWIHHMSATGFPVHRNLLLNSVKKLVMDMKRQTPFVNGRPSKRWYKSFLSRHPEVALKVAQNLTLRRAEVSEGAIRNWFEEIKNYLQTKSLVDINDSRIFNCDESSFLLNPKPKKVLTARTQKTTYNRITSDEKECLTVLVTGNAAGQLAPPMVLYPYERIPHNICVAAPKGWSLGHSKNGWMTQESFFEYVTNTFYKWCIQMHIEFPIVLFVDGHSSHLTLALSDFCVEKEIELIALYPNATHLLQPMDVSVFRPLKLNWSKVILNWRIENNGISVDKVNFAPLLKKAIDMLDLKKILKNGFKACGLHPLSADNVNFSKLLKSNINTENLEVDNEEVSCCVKYIESNIEPNTLKLFKEARSTGVWTRDEKNENFFYFWLKTVHNNVAGRNHTEVGESVTNMDPEPMQEHFCDRSTVIIENNNLYNNICIPDNSEWIVHEDGTLEETSNLTIADSLQPLNVLCDENMDPNNNSEISLDLIENIKPHLALQETIPTENSASNKQLEQEESTKKKDSRIPSPFKRCLYWPQPKITDNKRKRKDKIPAVATSEEWREYHQKIVQRKQEAEAEKERRKIERLQKIKIKKEKDEEKKLKKNLNKTIPKNIKVF